VWGVSAPFLGYFRIENVVIEKGAKPAESAEKI
jgi:hypothetical protein